MMKITVLSHLFKWENLHNWWLTKYFFAPLYIYICINTLYIILVEPDFILCSSVFFPFKNNVFIAAGICL